MGAALRVVSQPGAIRIFSVNGQCTSARRGQRAALRLLRLLPLIISESLVRIKTRRAARRTRAVFGRAMDGESENPRLPTPIQGVLLSGRAFLLVTFLWPCKEKQLANGESVAAPQANANINDLDSKTNRTTHPCAANARNSLIGFFARYCW